MKKGMFLIATMIIILTTSAAAVLAIPVNKDTQNHFIQKASNENPQFLEINFESTTSADFTERDVQYMWQKVQLGVQIIDQFWQMKFSQNGYRYTRPNVKYYTSPIYTPCGTAKMNNAFYCPADHNIYFDAIFFVKIMKAVGGAVGSDGDMAIIITLAHEWGHAFQGMTGQLDEITIFNENNADCTAGAFTNYTYQQGWLEKGDLEEATYTLYSFGDNLPWHAPGAHDDGPGRHKEFTKGFKKGLIACGGGFR